MTAGCGRCTRTPGWEAIEVDGLRRLRRCDCWKTAHAVQPSVPQEFRDARPLKDLEIGAVPHGFRSSFRDWAAEETNHPREVVEAALAHVVQNKVEAAYARSDLFERRRRLMDDWAAYMAGERGQVIPLGR